MNKELKVPLYNIEAYSYMYSIENTLREFIIEKLNLHYGSKWYKTQLIGDALKKYKEGREYEKKIKWSLLIPHHPIYYIDFSHIRQIIEKGDNWKNVFQEIFERKDIICTTLSEIEFIRNKVAHNRKVSDVELKLVENVYIKIESYLGKDKVIELSSRCTSLVGIRDILIELKEILEVAYLSCSKYEVLDKNERFKAIIDEWWFDDSFLGSGLNAIQEYYNTLEEYSGLSRYRGKGYIIEKWVNDKQIKLIHDRAQEELNLLFNM